MDFVINRDIAFVGGELMLCQTDVRPFDMDIGESRVHVCTPAAFLNILTDLVNDSDLLRFDSWDGSPRKSRAIINHSIAQLEAHAELDSRIHCPEIHPAAIEGTPDFIIDPDNEGCVTDSQPMPQNIVATGEDFGDRPPAYLEDYEALVDFTFANLVDMEHEGGVTRLMINSEIGEGDITEFVHWLRVVYWAFYRCCFQSDEKSVARTDLHGKTIYEPHIHGQIFSVFIQVPLQEDFITSISSARAQVE